MKHYLSRRKYLTLRETPRHNPKHNIFFVSDLITMLFMMPHAAFHALQSLN